MVLTAIVLDQDEKFIQYLNDDNLRIAENNERSGVRGLSLEYVLSEDEDSSLLFKGGNKIWIQGDPHIDDCLYVINPEVEKQYDENRIILDVEEVLVELNFAPYFSQTDLTAKNGFTLSTVNGELNVKVNYDALHFWFGDYFNIGIVQDCLSEYLQRINVQGTMSLMSLLRYIEEETSNFFRTRYEKDPITNVIHRYLDFLNPSNANTNWELNINIDIPNDKTSDGIFDENGDPTDEDDEKDDDDTVDEYDVPEDYSPGFDVDIGDWALRFVDENNIILQDDEGTNLYWSASEMGLSDVVDDCVLCVKYINNQLNVIINDKSYAAITSTDNVGGKGIGFSIVANDPTQTTNALIPNHSKIQLIDSTSDRIFYQQTISPGLGDVHDEILDLGYNVENISLEVDESDTYTAISPAFTNTGGSESLTRTQINTILNNWRNLSVNKGDVIPMIVQKITNTGTISGTSDPNGNYFARPLKPNDNTTSSPATYEYWRGTAYWKAPFDKVEGEDFIQDTSITDVEYQSISGKKDFTDGRAVFATPKIGPVETSEEDKYAIYNAVAMKLKDKRVPNIKVTVDINNYQNETYNNYKVHDKVYIKIPGFEEIITAVVSKTSKNPHDISDNSVELTNYSINAKVAPKETIITGSNISFKYPNKGNLELTLSDEEDNVVSGKLITCSLYTFADGTSTLTKTTYNKITNSQGKIILTLGYDPGNYEIEAKFGGDEEYESSSSVFVINVSGKKVVNQKKTKVNNKKIDAKAKKTTTKKKVKKLYWSNYGVNPDKNLIFAIGLPTHPKELAIYGNKYRGVIFSRKCPVCGSTQLYWGWKFGTYFRNKRVDSAHSKEGMILCEKCSSTFSIFGIQNDTSSPKQLKKIKDGTSSVKDAQTLKNGKYVYEQITLENKKKKVTSKKERVVKNKNIPKSVSNMALKIVKDSTGYTAAKKIVKWVGSNIKYEGKNNFYQSTKTTLARRRGNCCCQTELMLQMLDAAGCTEHFTFVWCHVVGNIGGHVFARLVTKTTGKYRYVDPVHAPYWGTCLSGAKYGYAPGTMSSNYPSRPF